MYYQNDWILREIQMMARFIVIAIFGKDIPIHDMTNEEISLKTDFLRREILNDLKKKHLCKAEDRLFRYIDSKAYDTKDVVKIALDFYETISGWTDEDLEDANFPRDEILLGLQDLSRRLNLSEIDKIT